jgi:hypothetical protein
MVLSKKSSYRNPDLSNAGRMFPWYSRVLGNLSRFIVILNLKMLGLLSIVRTACSDYYLYLETLAGASM